MIQKFRGYFKGKSLKDIAADLDEGLFLKSTPDSDKNINIYNDMPLVRRRLVGIEKSAATTIEIKDYPASFGQTRGKADHKIDSDKVSRMHMKIYRDNSTQSCCIEDLDSTNGTFVNGRKLKPFTKVSIKPGDIIRMGDMEYVYR